jgi:hypothetical protein
MRLLRLSVILLGAACMLAGQSCLPYRGFARNKQSGCLFFVTGTKTVVNKCAEGNYKYFASIEVRGRYDTVKYIDSRPVSFYPIFESTNDITLPFSLIDIIPATNNEITISFGTNSRAESYALSIRKEDWTKDTLAFIYYYHR